MCFGIEDGNPRYPAAPPVSFQYWINPETWRCWYSYGHLLVITGYFYGIIHSINGVLLVLITGKGP